MAAIPWAQKKPLPGRLPGPVEVTAQPLPAAAGGRSDDAAGVSAGSTSGVSVSH